MKDVKEVVLFFKEKTKYDPLDVAKEIVSRYEELGNPIILPEENSEKLPLFLFNRNSDFQIQATKVSVSIVAKKKYFEKLPSIVFDIVDAFEEFKCNFKRIGYIMNIFLPPASVERSKKRFLQIENVEGLEDYNLNWYKKIETKLGNINVWERIITDKDHFSELLCQYDFNSLFEEEISLDMKYIKEFIHVADEYANERTNF